MELSKVTDPRQRADVAAAMEELSDFNYLLDRVTLAQLEMDAGLDRIYGAEKSLDEYLALVAPSFAHGFGRIVNLTVRDADGKDTSAMGGTQMSSAEARSVDSASSSKPSRPSSTIPSGFAGDSAMSSPGAASCMSGLTSS